MTTSQTVLITGASSGIGRELARQLAPRASRLVLVARREAALQQLADEVARSGLTVELLPADLADATARAEVARRAADLGVDLCVLAAGAGTTGLSHEVDPAKLDSLIQLNLVAPAQTIQAVLPAMRERRRGQIMVIGSGAGLVPMAGQATYVASKHGLHGWCESVRLELKGTGVTLTEVLPGPVETEFDVAAGLDQGMDSPVASMGISAEQCARDAVRALDRGRDLCFPGRRYGAFMALTQLMPARLVRTVTSR